MTRSGPVGGVSATFRRPHTPPADGRRATSILHPEIQQAPCRCLHSAHDLPSRRPDVLVPAISAGILKSFDDTTPHPPASSCPAFSIRCKRTVQIVDTTPPPTAAHAHQVCATVHSPAPQPIAKLVRLSSSPKPGTRGQCCERPLERRIKPCIDHVEPKRHVVPRAPSLFAAAATSVFLSSSRPSRPR